MQITLNLDKSGYTDKESAKKATGAICNRTKCTNGIVTINPEQLKKAIESGKTFTPGVLTGTSEADWRSQQIIAADIDNKKDLLDEHGNKVKQDNKVVQVPCEHIITPREALEILNANNLDPYLMYYSFSNTKELPKFRILFVLSEKLTDGEETKKLTRKLAYLFNSATKEPNADMSISNLDRLLFGSTTGSVFYSKGSITDKRKFDVLIDPEEVKAKAAPTSAANDRWSDINAQEKERLKRDIENFDLLDYILRTKPGSHTKVRGHQTYINPCPVCGHNDDFKIKDNKAFWACYSSATSDDTNGSIIDYLMEVERMDLSQALDYFKHDLMHYPRKEYEKKENHLNTAPTSEAPTTNDNATQDNSGELPQICCVADIEKKDIQFLIEPYIIKNNITAIVGDGGVGKTFVWVDIASAITNNRLPQIMGVPFDTRTPNADNNKVLYFTSEDNTAETLKERFEKAGANLNNLLFVPLEDKNFHNILLDSKELEELIKQAKPALCVLDPLQSFVRGKMADRNNMRRQLDCLTRLAKVYNVSFLIIVHTNKSTSTDARTKLSDSSDIWDKCRSVLFVGKTSKNEVRYLSQEKGNYTNESNKLDTQLFAIKDGRIEHRGTTDKKYYDFATETIFHKDTTVKDTAKEFVLNTLKDKELKVKDLEESAQAYGISKRTLDRAKNELRKENKVRYRKEAEGHSKGVQWYISLNPVCDG